MAIRSFEKSWVVTIRAPAALDAAFKKCSMRSGRFDGSPRDYFFPRIADSSKTPRKQRGRRRKSPPAHSTSIPLAEQFCERRPAKPQRRPHSRGVRLEIAIGGKPPAGGRHPEGRECPWKYRTRRSRDNLRLAVCRSPFQSSECEKTGPASNPADQF